MYSKHTDPFVQNNKDHCELGRGYPLGATLSSRRITTLLKYAFGSFYVSSFSSVSKELVYTALCSVLVGIVLVEVFFF